MPTLKLAKCRTCGSKKLVAHCPPENSSSKCDLIRCQDCKSFGNDDRWCDRSQKGGH